MKRALVVGINYIGTGNDLRGCLNDAENMASMLKARGFEVKQVLEKLATTQGIISGLEWLIAGAVPGDVLVFHYSGHGSQLPSRVESDGFEEIICPIDLNWRDKVITDDTLRSIFNRVPNGVNTTVILDCCHSGTGLDQMDTLEIARVAYGGDPSKSEGRFLTPPDDIVSDLQTRELVDWRTERDVNASALLIAGCHATQTSADAFIDGSYQGAATASLLKTVAQDPDVTYQELVMSMNDFMARRGFTQIPQLDGYRGLYAERFLSSFGTPTTELEVHAASLPPEPEPAKAPPSARAVMLIAAAAACAAILYLLSL